MWLGIWDAYTEWLGLGEAEKVVEVVSFGLRYRSPPREFLCPWAAGQLRFIFGNHVSRFPSSPKIVWCSVFIHDDEAKQDVPVLVPPHIPTNHDSQILEDMFAPHCLHRVVGPRDLALPAQTGLLGHRHHRVRQRSHVWTCRRLECVRSIAFNFLAVLPLWYRTASLVFSCFAAPVPWHMPPTEKQQHQIPNSRYSSTISWQISLTPFILSAALYNPIWGKWWDNQTQVIDILCTYKPPPIALQSKLYIFAHQNYSVGASRVRLWQLRPSCLYLDAILVA